MHKTLAGLSRLRWSVTYKGVFVGFLSGLLGALYRLVIEFGTEKAITLYAYLKQHPALVAGWLLVIVLASALLYLLMRLEPYAKSSGIPQVEGIVLLGMKMRWWAILPVRFAAGFLGALFGLSLGREGPMIQIGACGGQAVAKGLGKSKLEDNYLITAGASAGLSGAFNAPLSGIIFALEEVHRTFSPNILIASTTAALTADTVSKYFFGLRPVLSYATIPELPITDYGWLLPLGLLVGLMGALTNRSLLAADTLYGKLPEKLRPALALLFALPCGLLLPQVLGSGQNLIELSEEAKTGILLLCLYLVCKLLFTCTSFGSGLPGGIFMPILAIGALTGSLFGQVLGGVLPVENYVPVFCVCAMAGAMSSAVKAPVTSILLMAEMTGSLVHLLPVALVAFVALLTSDLLGVSPIYEVLLERMTGKGHPKTATGKETKSHGVILEVPVELGSSAAGKKISEVDWPQNVLVAGVRRGHRELVPSGETRLLQGDYLVVLSSEAQYEQVNRALRRICYCEDRPQKTAPAAQKRGPNK